MGWLIDVPWTEVLQPQTPLLEILARGTLTYLSLLVLLRVVLKRQAGAVGTTDLLVVVLIADAAQNAMAGGYESVPDGILLVAVILGWAFALDWLAFRSTRVERFIKPPKLKLVEDGRPLWRNMARELVTMDELRTELREQGVEDLEDVRHAFMEHDGRISVTTHDHGRHDVPPGPPMA